MTLPATCSPCAAVPRLLSRTHLLLRKGASHATRNDRTRPDGRQHGAAAAQGRPRVRGLRHVAEGGGGAGQGEGGRGLLARGLREEAGEAAGGLADGPGGRRGQDDRRPPAASRGGRHPHRRRQFLLRRRHPPRQGARAEGDPLRRRRHQRRRLGPGARLLHDDRRRDRTWSSTSIRSSRRWRPASATSRARRAARRSAAPPSRATCTAGRTAPATSSRWSTTASSTASWPPTPRGWASCATPTSASDTHEIDAETTPLRDPEHYQYDLNLPRHRRGVAARQRDRLVAARPDGDRAGSRIPSSSEFAGRVSDSGEGRWTIKAAIDEAVPVPVLTTALYERFSSRGEADFQDKLLSAMRFQFGGHLEKAAAK